MVSIEEMVNGKSSIDTPSMGHLELTPTAAPVPSRSVSVKQSLSAR